MVARRIRIAVVAAVAAAVALGLAPAAGAVAARGGTRPTPATPAAAPAPTLTARPTGRLVVGSQVGVHLRNLPAHAAVSFVECDQLTLPADPDNFPYCPDIATSQATAAGRVDTVVAMQDPVYLTEPFGDPEPVYCRNDQCRLYAVWTDASGQPQSLSVRLWFLGSAATITAQPSDALTDGQRVIARGTAYSAAGRTLVVVEEACFDIIQGSGCYGTITLGSVRIGPHGAWYLPVHVHRLLADGTDCSDAVNILGTCQLTARVLTSSGQPDDTFGVARLGDPGAVLTFAVPTV